MPDPPFETFLTSCGLNDEASELTETTEVNETGEIFKAWKITTEDFRVVFALEFNNLRTNITLF